jgi:hypothetical protein
MLHELSENSLAKVHSLLLAIAAGASERPDAGYKARKDSNRKI